MLRKLNEVQPGIKSIVITGLGEEHRIAEAKAAGANVVLNKPFTAEQLLTNVRQLLA
jgi:CheY-like chemotaxis protein